MDNFFKYILGFPLILPSFKPQIGSAIVKWIVLINPYSCFSSYFPLTFERRKILSLPKKPDDANYNPKISVFFSWFSLWSPTDYFQMLLVFRKLVFHYLAISNTRSFLVRYFIKTRVPQQKSEFILRWINFNSMFILIIIFLGSEAITAKLNNYMFLHSDEECSVTEVKGTDMTSQAAGSPFQNGDRMPSTC